MATRTSTHPAAASARAGFITRHPLLAYFVIAFAGTWALLLPFALSRGEHGLGMLPFRSDLAFLIAFVLATLAGPALASLTVTALTAGRVGVRQLLRRCVHWRVGIRWSLIALCSFLLIYLLGYSIFLGTNLPIVL